MHHEAIHYNVLGNIPDYTSLREILMLVILDSSLGRKLLYLMLINLQDIYICDPPHVFLDYNIFM